MWLPLEHRQLLPSTAKRPCRTSYGYKNLSATIATGTGTGTEAVSTDSSVLKIDVPAR